MRFIIAVVVVVLAALMVALGFAQRTVFAPPSSVSSSVSTSSSEATVTVVPASALHGREGRQAVSIDGADTAFAATGRTSDVLGWVGDADYNLVEWDADAGELTTRTVAGDETAVPDPADSDLWYDQYSGSPLTFSLDAPDDVSLVVVSDGTAPAPADLAVTWPLSQATPTAGPLIVGGLLTLLIGVLLYIWAIVHHRRTRGPRRTSSDGSRPKLSRPSRRRALKAGTPESIDASASSGARRGRTRRSVAVVPVLLVGSLALAGCSADYWPAPAEGAGASSSATATPTATPTDGADAEDDAPSVQPPVVTVAQAERIVERIAAVAAQADGALDAALAETRFTGPALQQRQADYVIRAKDAAAAGPLAIPAGDVTLTLPQQSDTWPRTLFTVVQDADATKAPVALTLLQETARDPYKVEYAQSLEAQATLPTVAPATIGAARLAPDVKLLTLRPDQLAEAYGDILRNGDESQWAPQFQGEGDTLRDKIGKAYKDAKRTALPTTASIEFSSTPVEDDAVAFATNDAGALVSVALNEVETVKPTAEGASVEPQGVVKSLLGLDTSKKGIEATYGVQLLFQVPPVGSDDKIVLLGFSQALIQAKELP
ncbi:MULTISPECIES: hypothetical protein [unclassified Frigoribacterium]|uniref:hypothetical protein n=1 Tax=unclassified Frigoribacterium TaxID=2627005 RepID=UPI000F47957F|nr:MULTISPECIES: hypothetical protein [unclassified Frigoribacterium]ROP78092.1 hypothetical protein EDF18_0736 [Frigoribacterium sp. PhB107]TDT65934.1 hypothetical protein EDF20_0735 [Frigoribacterium sp. PhB116]